MLLGQVPGGLAELLLSRPRGACGHAAPWQKVGRKKAAAGSRRPHFKGPLAASHQTPSLRLPRLPRGLTELLLKVSDLALLPATALCPRLCLILSQLMLREAKVASWPGNQNVTLAIPCKHSYKIPPGDTRPPSQELNGGH